MSTAQAAHWTTRPNLSSEEFWAAPIAERAAGFAALRQREPVAFFPELPTWSTTPGPGYWALTRMDDVCEVSRNPSVFVSGQGYVIDDMPPEFYEFYGVSLLNIDAPRHTRLRRIVSQGFTPRRMDQLHAVIASLSREIIDDVIETGECEAVDAIAARLPVRIICELMGVPASQYDFVVTQTNIFGGSTDPEYLPEGVDPTAAIVQAAVELSTLINDLGRFRQENPTEDLTSALVNAQIDGETLTPGELSGFFNLLLGAGSETTRNSISWGIDLLSQNPHQRAAWLADVDAVTPTAVDEIVRLSCPAIYMRRTLAVDAALGGQAMRAGDKVAMFYWAANRDPEHFTNPDDFDVARAPNPHVGFGGHGQHYCLGAHLARKEIAVMFREILTRIPDIHSTAEPERLQSNFINGIKRLPVAFTPRSR